MSVPARWTSHTLILAGAFAAGSTCAADTTTARLYEVTVETGMPHLEENLRYAVTREKRCLTDKDLASAFPILKHPALADCKLQHERREAHVDSYILVCQASHGTTGNADWRIGEQLLGQLDVKLGGKNMTFFQRVTAKPLGQCPAAAH
jgi:hypothetical protein